MRDNLFDKYISQKINDYSSAVPDDMWQRIVDAKEPKRRMLFGFWQYVVGGSFIILSFVIGWQIKNNFINSKNISLLTNNKMVSKEQKLDNQKPFNKQIQVTHSLDNTAPVNSTTFLNNDNSNNTKIVSRNTAAKIDNKHNKNQITNLLVSANGKHNNELVSSNKSNILPNFGFQNSPKINDNGKLISINNQHEFAFRLKNPWQQDWYSPDRTNKFAHAKQSFINSTKKVYLPKIECPKSGDPMLRDFNIEIYASPDLVMKNTTPNKPVSGYYLSRKDSSETNQASFTFGARLSKAIGENMVFKTGVQYAQINTKFSYKTENERRLTTVITSRVIVRSPGDTIIVKDTSVTEQIGYSLRTSYNKLSSIDIPILLGYEWSFSDWKIGLNVGPIINISSWQKGETLDTSFQPLNFSKNKTVIFKKNMGLALYGGLSIIKNVGEKTSIFAEPYFRYNLSSSTNSSSLLNEKYKVAGVLLGVRYNLSKAKATH